jgi:RNA polymerase sigma-70 factor (ECF subfamily)
VARRRAIDRLRREIRFREKLAQLDGPIPSEPDNRLELIFTCCHPALAPEGQVALTLRAVCGLTTGQIARAFMVSESTVAQRIVRARRKIVQAGIPYRVPRDDELDPRLNVVLSVLYLTFNEGYLSGGGPSAARREVADDARWLAELLSGIFPTHPEVLGLVALIRLHLARAEARFDSSGELVLLRDQDRTRWDRAAILQAIDVLEHAAAMHQPGEYQLQAAIAACHAEARSWAETDWPQILILYDMLVRIAPSPVAQLNRCVALKYVVGADAALSDVEVLAPHLDSYHLWHAVRADLLHGVGRHAEAQSAERRALESTDNLAEQSLLKRRLQHAFVQC